MGVDQRKIDYSQQMYISKRLEFE